MFKTKQIFDKYYDEITRFQFKYFLPTSALNLNAENKKTTFKLNLKNESISKKYSKLHFRKFQPVRIWKILH